MHPEWKRCLQGISRTVSCSSNSSKHTGHLSPLSVWSARRSHLNVKNPKRSLPTCGIFTQIHADYVTPACSGEMMTTVRVWTAALAAGGGSRWSQSDKSNTPESIKSRPCIKDLNTKNNDRAGTYKALELFCPSVVASTTVTGASNNRLNSYNEGWGLTSLKWLWR